MGSRGASLAPRAGTSPLTCSRPSRIQRSTSRREPTPAADSSFCTRSVGGWSFRGGVCLRGGLSRINSGRLAHRWRPNHAAAARPPPHPPPPPSPPHCPPPAHHRCPKTPPPPLS